MNRDLYVQILSGLLILLFLYAGLTKAVDFGNFQSTLSKGPGMSTVGRLAAWMIVLTEWVAVALLFWPPCRLTGLFISFALLSVFTIYIVYMLFSGQHKICGCGGLISALTWPQHIAFNVSMILLTFAGIAVYPRPKILLQQAGSKPNTCIKK